MRPCMCTLQCCSACLNGSCILCKLHNTRARVHRAPAAPALRWRFCISTVSSRRDLYHLATRRRIYAHVSLRYTAQHHNTTQQPQESYSNFSVWELTLFVVVASVVGLTGAAFVAVNKRITLFRKKHISSRNAKTVEVLVVVVIMTIIS